MKKLTGWLALAALTLAVPAVALADGPWIHIEVTEAGSDGANVKVNLPLSMARTALEMAPSDVIHDGHIEIDNHEFTVSELRRLWEEMRDAGDAEFVTVKDHGDEVRIFRKGDMLYVHVDEDPDYYKDDEDERRSGRYDNRWDGGHGSRVRVQVPVSLVDALLSGSDEHRLNLDAAIAELQQMNEGEVVRVEDGKDLVRIWID